MAGLSPGEPVKAARSLAKAKLTKPKLTSQAFVEEWDNVPSVDYQFTQARHSCKWGSAHVVCLDLSRPAHAKQYASLLENQIGESNPRGTIKVLEAPVEVDPDPGKLNFRIRLTYREVLFKKLVTSQATPATSSKSSKP